MKRLTGIVAVVMVMVMVMFWCGSAMAYDPLDGGWNCSEFIGQGDNLTCLGLLAEAELNGSDFQAALSNSRPDRQIWSPIGDLTVQVKGYDVVKFQVDNRRFGEAGRTPDSRVKFAALKNVRSIPKVYAVQVDDPGDDCTPDSNWHFNLCGETNYTGPYPVVVYHIDWTMTPECEQSCEDQEWNWEPGDGSPCAVCYDDRGDGFPNAYNGTFYRQGTYEDIPLEDIAVTWVETGETVGMRDRQLETYWYKSWNTGHNYQSDGNGGPVTESAPTTFAWNFSDMAPVGMQNYLVTIAGGPIIPFAQEIFSDRVMPTVSATTEGLTFQKVRRNGKIKTKTRDITVVNITTREVVNDAGETVLVVQWTVPDEVLKLSPYEKSLRLRIYVGNGWFTDASQVGVDFAWIDAPLHTSSVVVPAEVYEWVKATTLAKGITKLDIAGMYREQFNGYHNRGYFEGVTFDLPEPEAPEVPLARCFTLNGTIYNRVNSMGTISSIDPVEQPE
ncbi:hypothetical protein D1BOALGB6SA_775 [Olavius sp. associated proteobacterium Delta 1]|nr:hypothetical protein D1BOALGB6SA_775 [Olavius sp. associated proteobacterium Delta 1]